MSYISLLYDNNLVFSLLQQWEKKMFEASSRLRLQFGLKFEQMCFVDLEKGMTVSLWKWRTL